MISFKTYLTEQLDKPTVLRHLEHPEDLMLDAGKPGFEHAVAALKDVHEKLTGGFNGTRITEKYDGCVDAFTMLITSEGDQMISDIPGCRDGVMVLQQDLDTGTIFMGKVLGYGATDGDKDWIEIQFENGSTLTCTVDHPVYTENRGWVAAGDLTEDDDVRAY